MLPYRLRVRALKQKLPQRVVRKLRQARGQLPPISDLIDGYAPGKSFADIGCMWKVDGAHAFRAEARGATRVVAVDLFKTPEFDRRYEETGSRMEVILGSIDDPAVRALVGQVDIVWCLGLLYHHPSPYRMLRLLRSLCRERLVLESLVIPEMSVRQAAVYLPYLPREDRDLWTLPFGATARQQGVSDEYRPEMGYAANYWAMSPSCVEALLQTAGFDVEESRPSAKGAFRHLWVARAARPPALLIS